MTFPRENLRLLLALVLLLFAAVAQTRRVIRAAPGEETTGNYIVVLRPETNHSRFEAILNEVRNESVNSTISEKVEGPFAKIVAARISEEAAHRLKHKDGVEFIEEETYAEASSSIPWSIDRLDQISSVLDGKQFEPCECGDGVDIYILDTGINYNHCDFDGRAKYPGYDPTDVYEETNLEGADCHYHGTHVASLAAGREYGVARCATVYSVRVLNCRGRGAWSVIIDGVDFVGRHVASRNPRRPAVISMSLGGSFSSALNRTVTNAINRGIPVIAAAGNERDDACQRSPASTPDAVTVGGSARGDGIYLATNAGPCVDIFAPGASVAAAAHSCSYGFCDSCSSSCHNCTRFLSGTSMATPLVAGAVALMLEKEPSLTPASISQKLKDSCLKNAIDFKRLNTVYQNITNNCLLYIEPCNDTCRNVTYTSTSVVTQTITYTRNVIQTSLVQVTLTTTSTAVSTRTIDVTRTVTHPPMPTPTCTVQPIVSPSSTPLVASSCADLLHHSLKSGQYTIETSNGAKAVYCELEKEIQGHRGFMRIAHVDMSAPDSECPDGLYPRRDGGLQTCQRQITNRGCSSTLFRSSGVEYSRVCGRIRGYQWASPNAFYWYQRNKHLSIDDIYVDGVVLTYQNNSKREHIWTFAAAIDEYQRSTPFACQCTNKNVQIDFATPSFVGEDYFCETGSRDTFRYGVLYTDDPLWDGKGCGEVNTCCEKGEWFCKDVPRTSSDIELRLCGNEDRSNEDTPLEIIELYVQ